MKGQKPLIEKYITYLRVSEEEARARFCDAQITDEVRKFNFGVLDAYNRTYVSMAERSLKYYLAPSAQAMVEALRPRPLLREEMSLGVLASIGDHVRELDPDIQTPILHLPDRPIWLVLHEPISTLSGEIAGMFFSSSDHEIDSFLKEPQTPMMQKLLTDSGRPAGGEHRWQLHFINERGIPTSHYRYYEQSQAWGIIPDSEPCPTEECALVDDPTGNNEKIVRPCAFCSVVLAHWRSWFVTAMLALQGEFAATENREWPQQEESTTRKVRRAHSGRYDEIPVRHTYYYVNFDASVKRQRPPRARQEPETSWVEDNLEIDPESVVYMKYSFGTGERNLDPARNSRWKRKQTVKVAAFERSSPITVATLQRKITRVIASAYEKKEEGTN